MALALLFGGTTASHASAWSNTSKVVSPAQDWSIGTNWVSSAIPGPADFANVSTGGVAVISSNVSILTLLLGNSTAGGSIYIESGGSFSVTSSAANGVRLGISGPSFLTVESSGTFSAPNNTIAVGSAGAMATVNSAGVVSSSAVAMQNTSVYNMTGGTLTTVSGVSLANSAFNQSSGTVTANSIQISTGSVYRITGGSVSGGNTSSGLYFGATGTIGGTIQVVGSGATGITFGGLRNPGTANTQTWSFILDNGANHITPVTFTNNGQAGQGMRGGTLSVGLQGGVLLSATNSYTLIKAASTINSADYSTLPGPLWTESLANSSKDVQITLAGASLGSLDTSTSTPLTFAAAGYGHVDLTNTNLSQPLTLGLDVTGGTLSNFTTALTAAGISWSNGSGAYDLILNLNPSISGGTNFAWDFSSIDAGMQLQGLAVIPEPSTFAALLSGLGILLVFRRRSRLAA